MMDKQEATALIISRLEQGVARGEIAEELSQKLGAPNPVVTKFVDQVAATFEAPSPQPAPLPRFERDDIPSWILDLEAKKSETPGPAMVSALQASPSSGSSPVNPPIKLSPAEENLIKPVQNDVDGDALSAFVLAELKRQRRLNDIIEIVCQRTGWHWNEAQRFVARTRTEHHGEISKTQSRFMVPFSIIFVVGGILLLIWCIYALWDYYLAITTPGRTSTLAADFIPFIFGLLLTSLGVITGGIFGLYRTLSSRP